MKQKKSKNDKDYMDMSTFMDMQNFTEEKRGELQEKMEVTMDKNAIPDLDDMLEHIEELLSDIETPEMQELEKRDKKEFEKILTHKYYSLIPSTKIINMFLAPERYDNLERFMEMCDRLRLVKDGKKDMKSAYQEWCEKVNNDLLYPSFGGKEEFEKKMKEMQEKQNDEKNKK